MWIGNKKQIKSQNKKVLRLIISQKNHKKDSVEKLRESQEILFFCKKKT